MLISYYIYPLLFPLLSCSLSLLLSVLDLLPLLSSPYERHLDKSGLAFPAFPPSLDKWADGLLLKLSLVSSSSIKWRA